MATNKYIQDAKKYIAGVADGSIITGPHIRLAIQRHLDDLQIAPEKGWVFNEKAALRVFVFFSMCRYSPDHRRWIPFNCEPWQAAIVYITFGWLTAAGLRRFKQMYIAIPKKNGKTTFAAALANYLLLFDGEHEAEVYCAASVEKQSKIAFGKAKTMLQKSPALKSRCTLLTKNISVQSTGSKMEPLGRDSDGIEGINTHGAVVDEYHVWKNNDVLDNIESSTVNRTQPLVIIITTAGKELKGPCYDYHNICIDILEGIKQQDDTAIFIFGADEDDEWKDESTWTKANPNLGVSVFIDGLRTNFQKALNDPKKEADFKTKHINRWVDAPTVWVKDEHVKACHHGTTDKDIAGLPCVGGLDFASHVDIIALAFEFEMDGFKANRFYFWVPEAKVLQNEDRVDYRVWIKQGWMKMTPGEVIDIDWLVNDITAILQLYNVTRLGFDPYKMYHGLIQGLKREGVEDILMEYKQNIQYMSEPMKAIEADTMAHAIDLMGNPVIRWMYKNMAEYKDPQGNVRPDKNKSRDKIDGLSAMITARGVAMQPDEDEDIYTNHTLRTL